MRVIWSRLAASDLFEIADYYDRIDPDLAIMMMGRVERAPLQLLENPRIGPELEEEPSVRKWLIAGTPFLLFYALGNDVVEVRRVRHAAADWRKAVL